MSDTPTKAELLARLSAERAEWERAFGTLTREQLLLPDAVGFWSTKDLQDHITSNNRWMAVQLRALVRGELPTAEDVYGHAQTPPLAPISPIRTSATPGGTASTANARSTRR